MFHLKNKGANKYHVICVPGALDTTTIEIVPKNKVNDYIVVKKPSRVANQPFEHTFRLQVRVEFFSDFDKYCFSDKQIE